MTSIVKTSIVVPAAIQRRAGIKAGDRLEFKVAGGMIDEQELHYELKVSSQVVKLKL